MNSLFLSMVTLAQLPILYYMFPLTAAISLVYSATRYEEPTAILKKSFRLFMQIIVFMLGVLLLVYLLSYKL